MHYGIKQLADLTGLPEPVLKRYLAEPALREKLGPIGKPPLYSDDDLKTLQFVARLHEREATTQKTIGNLLSVLIEAQGGGRIPFLALPDIKPASEDKALVPAPAPAVSLAPQPHMAPDTVQVALTGNPNAQAPGAGEEALKEAVVAMAEVAKEMHRARVETAAANRDFLDAEQAAARLYPFCHSPRSVSRYVKPFEKGVWRASDIDAFLAEKRNSDSV